MKSLFVCSALLAVWGAAAEENIRGLIGLSPLSILSEEFLETIPAGTIQYGVAQVADDAYYQQAVAKGKKETTTTTTTTTVTTSSTTTTDSFVIQALATITCAEACADQGSVCYEGGQVRVNTDAVECIGRVGVDLGGQLGSYTPGTAFEYPRFFPTGCFGYVATGGDTVVLINENDFDTGELGCNAPAAINPPQLTQRFCVCT